LQDLSGLFLWLSFVTLTPTSWSISCVIVCTSSWSCWFRASFWHPLVYKISRRVPVVKHFISFPLYFFVVVVVPHNKRRILQHQQQQTGLKLHKNVWKHAVVAARTHSQPHPSPCMPRKVLYSLLYEPTLQQCLIFFAVWSFVKVFNGRRHIIHGSLETRWWRPSRRLVHDSRTVSLSTHTPHLLTGMGGIFDPH
jgi:hypothetical protein